MKNGYWLGVKDSNLRKQIQSLVACDIPIGSNIPPGLGALQPVTAISSASEKAKYSVFNESVVLYYIPISLWRFIYRFFEINHNTGITIFC